MHMLLLGVALGVSVGIVGAYTFHDLLKKQKDTDLLNANNYLHEEVIRLREQVALHINTNV